MVKLLHNLAGLDKLYQTLMCWIGNQVRILMAGLTPSVTVNHKQRLREHLEEAFAGYGMYIIGYLGAYLDISSHRVISTKQFYKECDIIKESA